MAAARCNRLPVRLRRRFGLPQLEAADADVVERLRVSLALGTRDAFVLRNGRPVLAARVTLVAARDDLLSAPRILRRHDPARQNQQQQRREQSRPSPLHHFNTSPSD
jgi:hypothetical protein